MKIKLFQLWKTCFFTIALVLCCIFLPYILQAQDKRGGNQPTDTLAEAPAALWLEMDPEPVVLRGKDIVIIWPKADKKDKKGAIDPLLFKDGELHITLPRQQNGTYKMMLYSSPEKIQEGFILNEKEEWYFSLKQIPEGEYQFVVFNEAAYPVLMRKIEVKKKKKK